MAPELTSDAWAQIRRDYEHTDRPVEEICAEHGFSSGTLRDRVRRWGWTRRRPPIPLEGPPPLPPLRIEAAPPLLPAVREAETALAAAAPQIETAPPQIETAPSCVPPAPPCAASEDAHAPAAGDDSAIVPRLQSAVARVLPAIEATVAKLAAQAMHPREMEQAARALASLTRTLRELNGLLSQHQVAADDEPEEDIEEFRLELARRMDAVVAARTAKVDDGA